MHFVCQHLTPDKNAFACIKIKGHSITNDNLHDDAFFLILFSSNVIQVKVVEAERLPSHGEFFFILLCHSTKFNVI